MARGIGSYKGVWNKTESAAVAPQLPVMVAPPIIEADDAAFASLQPALLEHRYRLLVLQEHRHKLGRDLLEAGPGDPWQLFRASILSFGKNFRPWAHARYFALACLLGVDMSPEILRQLRHPLHIRRYRRAMLGLWRLLEMLAQKQGTKRLSRFWFRLCLVCPPLSILIYERQLQGLLTDTQALANGEKIYGT